MVMKVDKEKLRQEMKKKRREFEGKREASKKACELLMGMEEYKRAKCVCVYMSAFGEADTSYIIDDLKKRGKKIVVPITDTASNTLSLSYLEGELKKGAYGISEPDKIIPASFDIPDFIVVPGICFDKNGGRIGFGKGYYDRFLTEAKGFKAGLCYSFQIADKIDCEPHDIAMDAVICEKEIIMAV